MNRTLSVSLLLAALIGLAGCVPERVVWSPDGTRAAVLAEDGLHIADTNGTLGPVIGPLGDAKESNAVTWVAGGKGLVVLRGNELASWKDLAAAFPEKAKAIAADAGLLRRTGDAIIAAAQTSATPDAFAQSLPTSDDDARWAAMYLRDQNPEALRPKVGERWAALAALTVPEELAQGYAVDPEITAGPIFWHGPAGVFYTLRADPGLSGEGVALAIIASEGDHGRKSALSVLYFAGNTPVPVRCDLGEGALYPDWSPDGKSLVYIKPASSGHDDADLARLGILVRQRLFDDADKPLFGTVTPLPKEESLVGLLFNDGCRVRVASDGRIFFAAAEVVLPTTPTDFDPKLSLFSIAPGKQATVSRVVPRAASTSGNAASFFDLSPDATHISVPSEDGRVSIIDLATGTVDEVQPLSMGGGQGDRLTSVPLWRPNAAGGELTFLAPDQKDGPATTVVRYSLADGKRIVFSEKWNDAARGNWLHPPAPATTAP